MATTTLWLAKKKAPDLFVALETALAGQSIHLTQDSNDVNPETVGLIPWFSLRPGAFISEFCDLWKINIRRFVLVAPVSGLTAPWSGLPARVRNALDQAIGICDAPSLKKLQEALDKARSAPTWAKGRIEEFAEARILCDGPLSRFSHNSKADITNQFLAPARLLYSRHNTAKLDDCRKRWRNLWQGTTERDGQDSDIGDVILPQDSFSGLVLKNLNESRGSLGQELAEVGKRITDQFDHDLPLNVQDLENVMALLTNIRESAGAHTHAGGGKATIQIKGAEPVIAKKGDNPFRVLVVDDHAAAWRVVFEQLQKQLSGKNNPKINVRFEFSPDGETVQNETTALPEQVHYSYYDLVILDVFLGGTTGTEILERLRKDFSHLPVLLWTTSRDQEITAQASLANGILLKKSVTWESLAAAVARWARRGRVSRTSSLPNPFFNHTIQNLKYRKLAVDCHEWCLKQLDSFHALDNEFFRHFTDHGGRHIVKLWELLEQALQPFLQDDKQILLPKNETQRELEILGLYLAVICHELGMFPMRIGNKVEDFSKLERGYLEDVRSLHAVRGMVLLHDNAKGSETRRFGRYWNDDRGRELGVALHKSKPKGLADRLAVLVGYHARTFKSMAEGDFLKWVVTDELAKPQRGARFDLAERLAKLASPAPSLSRANDVFRRTFFALAKAFKDTSTRERLRRQCALFRFVDALDITGSRNPAEFLVGGGTLPTKQYGENLKRELCQLAVISDGQVRVDMMPPAPPIALLKEVIANTKSLSKKKEIAAVETAAQFLEGEHAANRVTEPWRLHLESKASDEDRLKIIKNESALLLHEPLDRWLKCVWETLMGNGGKESFVQKLKELGILEGRSQEATLTLDGVKTIASITALSVAGELLDEYQAVVEAGLSDRIRLVDFNWDGVTDWSKVPPGVVTLAKALAEEEMT